jgi:hypothetical protein
LSDIGILNGPLGIAFLVALLGGPGFLIGAILGAVLWRSHRIWGSLLGAAIGGAAWFGGWAWFNDVI